mmetsp:Transcript_11360/g.9774  ORF Transcript_11360/g.9774 Transcript_11360/m.9774 type:complete len:170 (-) Transcript_11360:316-825(-)
MEYAPYGDLFDCMEKAQIHRDEKLVRTYFHQLIEGLEYLHKMGLAHLDLKLENLLIGDGFQLKICDFDFCYRDGDNETNSLGTPIFRAPEVDNMSMKEPKKADIFSAAICLFVMMFNRFPYTVDQKSSKAYLRKLFEWDQKAFWVSHEKIQGRKNLCSNDFKTLFEEMT